MTRLNKYIIGLLLVMGSTLPILAQSSGDGYNPPNPTDPGNISTMLSYKVQAVMGTEGAGTVSGGGYLKYGTVTTIKATAITGYKFKHWLKNDETTPYSTSSSFSYTVKEDVKFTAIYERNKLVFGRPDNVNAGSVTVTKRRTVVSEATDLKEVVVGEPSGQTNTLPFGNYYRYSTTEFIYTPDEIGCGGKISSLSFYVASAATLSSSVNIYLGHKASSTFVSASDYVPFGSLTLVYSGSRTLGSAAGWETYLLSTPFEYNGEDNLVVVVTKRAMTYTGNLKYSTIDAPGQALYRQTDNDTGYADASVLGNFSTSSSKPYMKCNIYGYVYGDREEAVLTATANTDYYFKHWIRNDETAPYSTDATLVYPIGDDEWEVNFTAVYGIIYNPDNPDDPSAIDQNLRYNVSVGLSDERAGSVAGGGRYKVGTNITVSTSGTVGYRFVRWLKNGQPYSTAKSFTYTVSTENVDFVAEYVNIAEELEQNGHAVNLVAQPSGSCTFNCESGKLYLPGASYSVTALPGRDFEFDGWYIGNTLVGTSLSYSAKMGDEEVALVARFRYNPFDPDDPDNPGGYVEEVETTDLLGDVNEDKVVDVQDVTCLAESIANGLEDRLNPKCADMNKDGRITAADIVELVKYLSAK